MDELERMYRRLVQNIRAAFPDLLTRPFEVSQLYQQIIPYRLNRRELGIDTNESYELALMQLLSGVRGFLSGDEEMQRALRAELESSNPDLQSFRAYATSAVMLNPDALRALDAQPLVRTPSPAIAQARPAANASVVASRATEEVALTDRPRGASEPARPAPPREQPTPAAIMARVAGSGCRYCGGELPEGREVVFCPHCGQNLTIKHCPACSTELELGWRFCITCGRQVD